jgi:hypothetical protein
MRTETKIDVMRVNSRFPRSFAAKLCLQSPLTRALMPFLC